MIYNSLMIVFEANHITFRILDSICPCLAAQDAQNLRIWRRPIGTATEKSACFLESITRDLKQFVRLLIVTCRLNLLWDQRKRWRPCGGTPFHHSGDLSRKILQARTGKSNLSEATLELIVYLRTTWPKCRHVVFGTKSGAQTNEMDVGEIIYS